MLFEVVWGDFWSNENQIKYQIDGGMREGTLMFGQEGKKELRIKSN